MSKIDFVITWVDPLDKTWVNDKNKYQPKKNDDVSKARYRDWGLLKYWFRGIEKYASFVNKIYFVTYGHIPKWLNVNNEKLVIVKHSDFMPKSILPTFNSIPIELYLHKIPNLSEKFVYFNDDVFLIDYVKENHFFKNGKPCDSAILCPIIPKDTDYFKNTLLNNMRVINNHFNKKEILTKPFNYFNLKYGKYAFKNIMMYLLCYDIPGFNNLHLPFSYNKDTFNKVWSLEKDKLEYSSSLKFRNNMTPINHYVFQYYQFITNNFYPRSYKFGKQFNIESDNDKIVKAIISKKYKCICINDENDIKKYKITKNKIINAFEIDLSNKSSFEL